MIDFSPLILVILALLCAMLVYLILQQQALMREGDALMRREGDALMRREGDTLREIHARLSRILDSYPVVLTDAMFEVLCGATFAILDADGHPMCCGFFVTPCGVALTAAHACGFARPAGGGSLAIRASTRLGQEFSLEVVSRKVGALDIAVLRVSGAAAALPPRSHLPLPSVRLSAPQLLSSTVSLFHGSIAWSAGASVNQVARTNGYIITCSDSLIHYNVPTCHSGAALLFRGSQVIGLHTEDLPQEHSRRTPSARADAVRLDVPQVWSAVLAAKAAPAAAAGGSARRRRPSTA